MSEVIKNRWLITPEEWEKYEWDVFDAWSDDYIRTYEKTPKPNDGYEYIDMTAVGDIKQVWVRGMKL